MKSAYFCLIYAFLFNCGHSTLLFPQPETKKLGRYGADANMVSMSGFSSGAIWSAHYHVAFSKEIMGVGLINGAPPFCGFKANRTLLAIETCCQSILLNNVSDLISLIKDYANRGLIDPVTGIKGDKVFILNCIDDTFVDPLNGIQDLEIYEEFEADIKTNFDLEAEHTMITTEKDVTIPHCPAFFPTNWLSDCDFDAAYELLNHIYGNLSRPSNNTILAGELYRFDQSDFTGLLTPDDLSMADYGYAYVPSHCISNTGCRVHVANHGCIEGGLPPYEPFVHLGGYNDVAEVNNIIILYPQMIPSLPLPGTPGLDQLQPFNPLACHDWIGYTTPLYAAKTAPQMEAFHEMINRTLSNGAK